MKTRFAPIRLLGLLFAGALATSAVHAETNSAPESKLLPPTQGKVLAPGMTAETILKTVGRPVEIKPIKVDEGPAEIWTYRRQIGRSSRQVPTYSRSVPAFTGIGADATSMIGTRSEDVYSVEHVTIYQVTTLLMFEGKLLVAKQTQEEVRSFY